MHRDVCGGGSVSGSGGKMSPLVSASQQSPPTPPPPPSSPLSPPTTPQTSAAPIESAEVEGSPSTAAASSIGVNLRVTGHCSQGGRKYMEDFFSVAYHQSENAKDLEYAFVGIYDGHGGSEAATFAKEHLMMEIINQKLFWSDSDQDVLRAIREGYIATHYAMWREQEKWPKTATGLPSTAGTTATVAFIRREKIYIGHVGDSGIVLGYQNPEESFWRARQLTHDHKPESPLEKARIMNSGGKVVVKSGVPRVVWNRPRTGHKGPVRRSTPIDEIPFLAVARSLGDLWSYNSALNEFVVSPDPDVKVIKINPKTFRCLIFGTDGLWNVISASEAVDTVREKEVINERISRMRGETNTWFNPSKGLVEKALKTWSSKKMRADNTSVVTVILYPPGSTPTKENPIGDCGLEYVHMNGELHSEEEEYTTMSSNPLKFHMNSMYEGDSHFYGADSFNQPQQLPHYDTIAPSSAMRLHLQQQQQQQHNPHQDGYMSSYLDRDDSTYSTNYETHCDTNGYLYYDDQASNSYMNSFAESYNSLLTSSLEREANTRSNSSDGISRSSDNSHESMHDNPNDYHSYHSLHHTGLAGHDRVQHHYPNNEHQMEQLLYQEQCMSAEEGYSLTKLETRGEQQLRGNSVVDLASNCIQTFQIFGGEQSSGVAETIYNQYNSISSSFQNCFHGSDSSNSNFLNSYEDDARCYEPNMEAAVSEELTEPIVRTTSLCIERLDSLEVERLANEDPEPSLMTNPQIDGNIEVMEDEKEDKENPDESIQIHEISSSVVEETAPTVEALDPIEEECPKPQKDLPQLPPACENVFDTTQLKKPSIPKLVLYPNVPNENHRTPRRASMQQYPRTFEKRMLRSMTVDFSKRTLRSRNSLSKDMKAKSAAGTSIRRPTMVQSKFIKAIQSSPNVENTPVISRKSLNLRSRQITTTTGMWSDSSLISSDSTSSSNQRQQRKTRQTPFCDNTGSSKSSSTPKGNGNATSSSGLLVTPVGSRMNSNNSPFTQRHAQQQIAISFAKRTSLRNSAWGATKTTMQTRNRVQKRLSR